jgi:hypothetical protein
MSDSLFKIIFLATIASTAIPILTFLLRWVHQPKHNFTILALLVFSLLSDVSIWYLSRNNQSSIFIVNSYGIIAFCFLSAFYRQIIFAKRASLVQYITIFVFLISLALLGVSGALDYPNNYVWAISSLILAINSILYFYFLPHMVVARYLDQNLFSNFVLNASLSLYFFTSIILFSFMDFVFNHLSVAEAKAFWSIHNIVNILKNLGIAFAFFLSGKRKAYISIAQLEKIELEKLK